MDKFLWWQCLGLAVAGVVTGLHGFPFWRGGWDRFQTWTGRSARRRTWAWGIALAGLSLAFNISFAAVHGIPLARVHDEYSYLLAADTFAHGRVTNPTPPLWTHFETPNILMWPSYQSKYPPGQGISLAFGELTTGLPIVGTWICQAVATAAIYWAFLAFLSEPWALLGGVIAALHPTFLHWSQDYWGGSVAVLGGAIVLGATARLVRDRITVGLAIGLGLGLVILANSRPYEGLLLAIPMLAALIQRILHSPAVVRQTIKLVIPLAVILVSAFAAMGYYSYRVTGNALRMPYAEFSDQYGLYPKIWLQPKLPLKIYHHLMMYKVYVNFEEGDYYKPRNAAGHVSLPRFAILAALRLGKMVFMHTDPYLLVLPLCFGLVLIWRDHRSWWWVFAAILTMFAGLIFETFFLIHYAAPVSATFLLLIMSGWRLMAGLQRRWGLALSRGVAVGCLMVSIVAFARPVVTDVRGLPRATAVARMPQLHDGKHLVFLTYDLNRSMNDEWAYNTADIANQQIIWARSTTPAEDAELANLYPGRQIWKMNLGRFDATLESYTLPGFTKPPNVR